MKIRLMPAEKDALRRVTKRYNWEGNLQLTEHQSGVAVAEINKQDATDLRELCSDYLTEVGFNRDYEPNEEGKILETLVDKLFVP